MQIQFESISLNFSDVKNHDCQEIHIFSIFRTFTISIQYVLVLVRIGYKYGGFLVNRPAIRLSLPYSLSIWMKVDMRRGRRRIGYEYVLLYLMN